MTCLKSLAAVMAACCLITDAVDAAPVIVESNNANMLTDVLIGAGVNRIGDATLTVGGSVQAGLFSGGVGDVGFDNGVVLSSGNVTALGGANTLDAFSNDFTTDLKSAGDSDLDALTGGFATRDAAVLEFDFEFDGGVGGDLFFSFVFGSEEYLEYVGTKFNDVFGFFVDGVNVALVNDDPISINTINADVNAEYYIDNPASAPAVDLAIDGLTTAIVVSVLDLAPGLHSMKFAIADTTDGLLDSAIFIGGGSFSSEAPSEVPLPGALPLLLAGLAVLRFVTWSKEA